MAVVCVDVLVGASGGCGGSEIALRLKSIILLGFEIFIDHVAERSYIW